MQSSDTQAPTVREYDELEGTLLPTAELVEPSGQPNDTTQVATVLSAVPINGPAPAGRSSHVPQQEEEIRYAPVIPSDHQYNNNHHCYYETTTTLHNSARHAHLLQTGEHRGRLLNEQEREDVRRNARDIRAKNNQEEQALNEANQRARQRQGQEDAGFVQTTMDMEYNNDNAGGTRDATIAVPPRTMTETNNNNNTGTFGHEYEVSEYAVGDYDTQDYQISEYKSVYDS